MSQRRRGLGHRIGNALSKAIFWICIAGIPLKACGR